MSVRMLVPEVCESSVSQGTGALFMKLRYAARNPCAGVALRE